MKQDMFFRVITRNTAQSPNQYAFWEDTPRPVWIHFCVRHRVWRSSSCVKLHCLCTRFRLGVVPTYYPVNSWTSRSCSCEESCFHVSTPISSKDSNCLHTIGDVETHFWRFYQNFPWSETHQFRWRYTILGKVQIFDEKLTENLVRDPPSVVHSNRQKQVPILDMVSRVSLGYYDFS
jgi:hypothetical protein